MFYCINAIYLNSATIIDRWLWPELSAAYERTYFPGSKTAVFYNQASYVHVIRYELNRSLPPKLLKERLMLECRALKFKYFHWLYEIFDRKLQQYIEADLINYNTRKWDEDSNPKKYEEYKELFAILTLGELEAGFVVCLVPFICSILVFTFEWLPTLKEIVVFLVIFKEYFKCKGFEQTNLTRILRPKIHSMLFMRLNEEVKTFVTFEEII